MSKTEPVIQVRSHVLDLSQSGWEEPEAVSASALPIGVEVMCVSAGNCLADANIPGAQGLAKEITSKSGTTDRLPAYATMRLRFQEPLQDDSVIVLFVPRGVEESDLMTGGSRDQRFPEV